MTAQSELFEYLAGAPYSARLGLVIDRIAEDRASVSLPFNERNCNPGGALHGGVYASMINIAGVIAALGGRKPGGDLATGTLDLSVAYLAAAIGEAISAEAEVLRRGKEITYCEIDVRSASRRSVARGLLTHRAVDLRKNPPKAEREQAPTQPPDPEQDLEAPRIARALVSTPFIASLGTEILHMKGGESLLEIPGKAENLDHDGCLHEGALAAFLDTAGAMAAWSITGFQPTYKASTVGIHVNYHAALRAEPVTARARVQSRNQEIFLCTVTLYGKQSRRIAATGSVTYRIVVPDEA
jgi:uncharacterized protein (TIGR00369 family)